MYFTYIGCQSTNVGVVGGTKADLGLSGTWTLLLSGNSVAVPASITLQSGKTYITAVGITNSTAKRLAFGSKQFIQP